LRNDLLKSECGSIVSLGITYIALTISDQRGILI
jgi:hypothetical protein